MSQSTAVKVVPLAAPHFEAFPGDWVPENYSGYCLIRNEIPVALGGFHFAYDRLWAFFNARYPVPALVHKYALKLLELAQAEGAECVWAELDDSRPGAEVWLRRCGFYPVSQSKAGRWQWRRDLDDLDGRSQSRFRSDAGIRASQGR